MRRRLGLTVLALGGILISVSLTWTLQRVVGPHVGGGQAATVIRGLAPAEAPTPLQHSAPPAQAPQRPATQPTAGAPFPATASSATASPPASAPPATAAPRPSRFHGSEPEAPEASGSDD